MVWCELLWDYAWDCLCVNRTDATSVGHQSTTSQPPQMVYIAGWHPWHSAINDIIKRCLGSAKISAHLEPVGICRSDGKRPDGATILPWKSGSILVWDATCPDTYDPSHIDLAGREAGATAKQAEGMKKAKYSKLSTTHHFIPVAVKTSGVLGLEACNFLQELGQQIREDSGEPLSHSYLLQRIAVAVQRGNAAAAGYITTQQLWPDFLSVINDHCMQARVCLLTWLI